MTQQNTLVESLLEDGWQVLISEVVEPDRPFVSEEDGERIMVFHPLNYSYASRRSIWDAHADNQEWIRKKIDKLEYAAYMRLEQMCYDFEHKDDPHVINFVYGTKIEENEDGSFTFSAGHADGKTMMFDFVQQHRDLIGAEYEDR